MPSAITPELELATHFVLDDRGRIVSTREPRASRGPLFTLIRSPTRCAWALRTDVADDLAARIATLVRDEPRVADLRVPPLHSAAYLRLTGGREGYSGPAFAFPDGLAAAPGVVRVADERWLQRNFRGWELGEIAAGRAPVLAVLEASAPVSICFSARRSESAAAAGLETASAFRGRGFGARVTAAWAVAIRSSGRVPLYSAAWTNAASLSVARKLGLLPHASFWDIEDGMPKPSS